MSIVPTPGAVYDLYREQIFNNPSTYVAGNSDDFRFNIEPQCPLRPNLTAVAPYTTQPVADSYHVQCKGDYNKVAWTSSFPVIPAN